MGKLLVDRPELFRQGAVSGNLPGLNAGKAFRCDINLRFANYMREVLRQIRNMFFFGATFEITHGKN